MAHTFLFEPGTWIAEGHFWSSDGREARVQGRTQIAHRPECWLLSGTMRVECSPPVEFVNAYSIEPPKGPHDITLKWTSDNPALGRLRGTFSAIGPSILSVYHCEGAGYFGAEHLAQVDRNRYEATGVLLLEDRRVSSWRVVLTRQLALAALLVTALLQAAPADAQTLRCGSSLIQPGARQDDVLRLCGEPQERKRITEPVRTRRLDGVGMHVVGTTTREIWRYERGYGRLPAVLTFSEDGILRHLEFEK